MRKFILMLGLCLIMIASYAQTSTPTPEYDYAMIKVTGGIFVLRYSDSSEKVFLDELLKMPKYSDTFTYAQARFMCFKYLNQQGYELVSGYDSEYIFKRPKK